MSGQKKGRNRGIRASRAKLTQALLNAGLKTQSSLAHQIAQQEGLDNIPKDLVNRVFREQSVDPKTLERIAAALDVPAHSLYLSSDELTTETSTTHSPTDENPAGAPGKDSTKESAATTETANSVINDDVQAGVEQRNTASVKRWPWALSIVAVLLVALLSTKQFVLAPNPPPAEHDQPLPKSIAIVAQDQQLNRAVAELTQQLPNTIRYVLVNSALIDPPARAANIAEQFQADAVLTFDLESYGRYQFSQIYYYYAGEQKQLAAIHHSTDQLQYQPKRIAERFKAPVIAALSGASSTSHLSLTAQKDFLQARQALEKTNSELHIKRAQTLLLNLLKREPDFLLAEAGLCQAKVYESWMGNEKQLLEEAEQHCLRAQAALPDHPYVTTSFGQLLTRSGRMEQAIAELEQLLELWPNDTDALYAMALAKWESFDQAGNEQQVLLEQAIAHLQLATQLAPTSPRLLTKLGTLHFYNGELGEMIQALEQSLTLEERFLTRFNLNSAYFCVGQPVKALQVALEASSNQEQSYLKEEMLGRGYYFSGKFDQAVKHLKQSIEAVGSGEASIHHKWGNLADAQRHQGDLDAAVRSYRQAMTVVERDKLRGNADINSQVFYAYYFQMLHRLDEQNYPMNSAPYNLNELEALFKKNSHTSGYFRLAIIFAQRNLPVLSRTALNAVLEECPGYDRNPDYALLIDQ